MINSARQADDLEAIFASIYARNDWGSDETRSGYGSTLAYTRGLRNALPALISELSVTSIFDAPCGDYHWMRHVRPALGGSYLGGDIVEALIETLKPTFQNADTQFVRFDITRDPFPHADLWICRDCLFHLTFADGLRAMRNFVQSDIPYALLTTHINGDYVENQDGETGGFRPLDLFRAPFNLPEDVVQRINDFVPPSIGREMCVWTREQIEAALSGPI